MPFSTNANCEILVPRKAILSAGCGQTQWIFGSNCDPGRNRTIRRRAVVFA
jgi:hypothetical protein